ncbi:MAG TPA: hypothetical protein VM370_07315 [Candidatus Thermoplasmatota archaeon]|nr:hypothetical protein [Candidatus Thermoplasmatota archaeon]
MVDVEPEQRAHRRGPVDPTGAVTSGVQPGPLRSVPEEDEEPVAGSKREMDALFEGEAE